MKPEIKSRLCWLIVGLLVVGLGCVEGWYGGYDYTGDALAYLDVSKAIARGDWAAAFSPYWGIGYPAVLAATRWMFSPGAEGDWVSAHIVNMVLFAATYAIFLGFLETAMAFAAKINNADAPGPGRNFVRAGGIILFVNWEIFTANVSRVGPDLLVSTVFFLVTAVSLRFCLRPRAITAVLLGLFLGLGYLIKAIFLPLSTCFLGVICLYRLTCREPGPRWPALAKLTWAIPAMALLALPYMAAMSMALGKFTTGESGGLNYAWCVNGMPSFEGWQGGPPEFGSPIHPTRLLLANPPVFEFATPYHVTYPPWYNPYYWYEGYHHFFSLKNQVAAIKTNLRRLTTLYFDTPHAPVKLCGTLALLIGCSFLIKEWRVVWRRVFALWPFWLPSIAGVFLYLMVIVVTRYMIGFFIVLMLVPLLAVFVPTPLVGKKTGAAILIGLCIFSAVYFAKKELTTVDHVIHNESYTSTDQWRVGAYLAQSIVHPGENVASVQVGDHSNNAGRTWATVCGACIVAETGNDAYDRDNQVKDFTLFISSPEVQKTVFALFHQAGAELVVAREVPGTPQGPGWEQVPGTTWWWHRL